MLFSDRYAKFIEVKDGEYKDYICGEIEERVKKKIAFVMDEFAQDNLLSPFRNNPGYTITTDALNIAIRNFNEEKEMKYFYVDHWISNDPEVYSLGTAFTPFLFDVIELQYEELSDDWKLEFQVEINKVFRDNDVPWVLSSGRMYKIDSQQFECDLKRKQLERLREISYSLPVFQSAYEEYRKALEFFQNEDYAEAVSNAGKSYESVMKIILKTEKGTADQLTKAVVKGEGLELPGSMTGDGFKDKVLMTLPYIRNNSTASHGAGMNSSQISKDMANLAINLAASLNTFLIDTYKEKISNKA